MLYALGDGAFATGSAVFFTRIVGLSAAQVGLGISVALATSFAAAIPLSKLVDRYGAKQMWVVAGVSGAAVYAVWPFVAGLVGYLAVAVMVELTVTLGRAARGAYAIAAIERSDRVRSMAFMRASLNVGFTLGALVSGVALSMDSDFLVRAVPIVTAIALATTAVFVSRLSDVPAAAQTATKRTRGISNKGFFGLFVCDGVLGTNQVLLNVVIPLWLVQSTDAPRVLLAWLFATNTVLTVLLQVPATRGIDTVDSALKVSRRSAALFVLSCVIILVTHDTVGWVTVALVWLGHITVTGAELFQAAGSWTYMSELSDPRRLGEYQGIAQLGTGLGTVWAPAAYTFLATEWGAAGWILIAAVAAVAATAMQPFARSALRSLTASGSPVIDPVPRPEG